MRRTANKKLAMTAINLPVKAKTVMTEATIAALDSTGYAVPGSKTEGLLVVGCVQEFTDNSTGEDGAATVYVERGAFVWENDGTIKVTDIMKDCYIAGPDTVTLAAEGASRAGKIIAVDEDGVTVDMMY